LRWATKISGRLTASLSAADRAIVLFVVALLATAVIAGWVIVHDLVKLRTNGSDPGILGGAGNYTEYIYARPDLISAAASNDFVLLTFSCNDDQVRFVTTEDDVGLRVMSDSARRHAHELIRFRKENGQPACAFRFKRESAKLGDYVARVFGQCSGRACDLPIKFEDGGRCSYFRMAMLNDENWSNGIRAGRPDVILLTDSTLNASGINIGENVFIGSRDLRVTHIDRSGQYAHLALSGIVSPEDLRSTGGWVCRKRSP
jgi:hypothetical protein